MTDKARKVLVLLSGGIDSSACVDYYLAQKFSVNALFVDYGQISTTRELTAAQKICKHYNVSLDQVTATGFRTWSRGYVPGRNAFLLYTALMAFRETTGIIAIGIHAGTDYSDCSENFIQTMQTSFDFYTDGCIHIGSPFINFSKRGILEYCKTAKVPIALTYSCELGKSQPCGKCLSCMDLIRFYAG